MQTLKCPKCLSGDEPVCAECGFPWLEENKLYKAAPGLLDALERIAKVRPAHLTVDLRQIVDNAIKAARGDD